MARRRSAGAAARVLALAMLMILFHPGIASAGWGNENWGEMIWGGDPTPVPSMSIEGLIALAIFVLVLPSILLARRRGGAGP
jgi:hypothetical protein